MSAGFHLPGHIGNDLDWTGQPAGADKRDDRGQRQQRQGNEERSHKLHLQRAGNLVQADFQGDAANQDTAGIDDWGRHPQAAPRRIQQAQPCDTGNGTHVQGLRDQLLCLIGKGGEGAHVPIGYKRPRARRCRHQFVFPVRHP